MLVKFIDFADQWDYHKRFIIYNLALDFHNYSNIFGFKKVIMKDMILKKFNSNLSFYLSNEIVYQEYYDFCYFYEYHTNKKEYEIYLKLIMDTINNYELNKKCIV
tara:strand:- start:1741 stop:2055 length:315 start_codon:yes stop_codon:yes gene_type:complete